LQRQKYKAFKQTVDVTFKNLSKHLQKKLEGKKKKPLATEADKQDNIPDVRQVKIVAFVHLKPRTGPAS
jgi:hypothetical protein